MSTHDPVLILLGSLERPVQPRAEFAESLLTRLLSELGEVAAPAGRPQRLGFRLARLLPTAAPRLRIALIVIALLLLLAGLATATYLGVREWVSAGPRGVQYTSDYRLFTVFREPPGKTGFWADFALDPSGEDMYAIRQPPSHPQRRAELVRVSGVTDATQPMQPEHVLSFDALQAPRLWDAGTDLDGAVIGTYHGGHLGWMGRRAQVLAVAESGDVFLVAGAWRSADEAAPVSVAVLVRHTDGSIEKVLTLRELVREALPGAVAENIAIGISASVGGRLLVKAHAFEPPLRRSFGRFSILEVTDPDGDGSWSDRAVRRLALPETVPTAERAPQGWQTTWITQIEADPSSRAFFLTTLTREARLRVFRLEDSDGDGDARDAGEGRVVLERSGTVPDSPPMLSVQPDLGGQFVVAGLERRTRLTLVAPSGEDHDVARSFDNLEDVLAGANGLVFPIVQEPGASGPTWVAYRLEPVRDAPAPGTLTAPAAPSVPKAPSPTRSVPRIAFTIESSDSRQGRIVTVRADGKGGTTQLLPGRFNHGFCQSANGKRMAYFSDAEAPGENFLYLADSDGTGGRKLTEEQVGFWCGFSERWLVLTRRTGSAMTLIRRDLRTGVEKELAGNVDRLALSPDGNQLVYAGGLDFSAGVPPAGRETLELLDLRTLQRKRLDGPLPRGSYGAVWGGFSLQWSPNGKRVAYVADPRGFPGEGVTANEKSPPVRSVLAVQQVATRNRRLRLSVRGGPPGILWSPDGSRLLVCVPARGWERGCTGGVPRVKVPARLELLDVATGALRRVTSGKLSFAGWAPDGSYLYANNATATLVAADGTTRRYRAPTGGWPAGTWIGFAPDGRYLGLGTFSSRLAVLDLQSGKVRVLLKERDGREFFEYRKWWR